jgi:hypothetical protein
MRAPLTARVLLLALSVGALGIARSAPAQADSTRRDSTRADSARRPAPPRPRDTTTVQGGVYNRPVVASAGRTSIGGYAEANSNYFVEDGVREGFSMELRRFNVFLFSSVGQRLRFLSELEFEHGAEEIAIETAQLDFQIDPAFVLRAGILLPPIGAFNQNHDSPRWEFIDRPLVSTRIIPSTLSEVGVGAYGRLVSRGVGGVTLTYDAYLTNGLGDGVVLNDEGRTLLAAGKREGQFAEDNNGSPALSGRLAVQQRRLGEVGVSYYGGIYNSFRSEGDVVDARRRLSIVAVDVATAVRGVSVRGEAAVSRVDVPANLAELFGEQQWGAHLDVVAPVWRPRVLGLRNAVLNAALRLEYVDYNVGTFGATGRPIRDDVLAVVPGVSFRPTPGTVFKANYRRHWTRALLGNPAARLGGYQVGFATYF